VHWVAIAFLGAGCATSPSGGVPPIRLRILTYNIRHGEGLDGQVDLGRVAEAILHASPDLVALQEVDRRTKRSGGVDQAAELGRLTRMNSAFGKAIAHSDGEHGLAVLSRWPIERAQTFLLPTDPKNERRAVLVIEARPPGAREPLVFISTHLSHETVADRQTQVEAIDRLLGGRDPLLRILGGDLNEVPGGPALKKLEANWTSATASGPMFTFPAKEPKKQIDFVLFRPTGRLRVVEARVLEEETASDHRPLLVAVETSE